MPSEEDRSEVLKEFFQTNEEFLQAIKLAVREEIADISHDCRFSVIKDEDIPQVNHLVGMVGDLGGGKIATGIECMRDNHKWLKKQRERGDSLSLTFLIICITSIVTGLGYAVWEGIKKMMGN